MRKHIRFILLAASGALFICIAATTHVQRVIIDEGPGIRSHRFWRVRILGQDRRLTGITYNATYQLTEYAPQKLWGLLGCTRQSGSAKLVSVEYPVLSNDK
jgi:hypothetical protein